MHGYGSFYKVCPNCNKKGFVCEPPCSLPSYILAAFAYIRQLPASFCLLITVLRLTQIQAGKKVGLKIVKIVEYASPEAEFMNVQFR